MRKGISFGIVILFSVLLFTGCGSSLYELDKETLNAAQSVAEEVLQPELEPDVKPDTKEYTQEELNQMESEKQNLWSNTEKNLSALSVSENAAGVKRYSDKNSLCKVVIQEDAYGTQNLEYEREYYFQNDVLYFVKLSKGAEEMHFYFHEGQLIRWIDAEQNSYDSQEEHEDFNVYGSSLLSEAYNLQDDFEAELLILDSYIG